MKKPWRGVNWAQSRKMSRRRTRTRTKMLVIGFREAKDVFLLGAGGFLGAALFVKLRVFVIHQRRLLRQEKGPSYDRGTIFWGWPNHEHEKLSFMDRLPGTKKPTSWGCCNIGRWMWWVHWFLVFTVICGVDHRPRNGVTCCWLVLFFSTYRPFCLQKVHRYGLLHGRAIGNSPNTWKTDESYLICDVQETTYEVLWWGDTQCFQGEFLWL